MAEKNLPIKFFQKRQKDEMGTEGGGGGIHGRGIITINQFFKFFKKPFMAKNGKVDDGRRNGAVKERSP